jgi:hypothetical protein
MTSRSAPARGPRVAFSAVWFEAGLERVLDGLAAHLPARR